MIRYDFRSDNKFWFEKEEIAADAVLSHIAKNIGVSSGGLEVRAENPDDAFFKFFGVKPEDACDLDETICPPMYSPNPGDSWHSEKYEIVPETSW